MKNSIVKNLCSLFLVFVKIGLFTIGGGLAMMPMIQKELIDKLHWMTEDDLLDYYAIGQSTPGIVAVNVATFIGYKQYGVLGGVFATLGIIFPSIVIITILASLINSISDFPIVQKALKGINVAV
ncbi:MAG: chromate transporter, partial [Treponema sp.]|nr:chromate transporter [Treponema sp.]